MRGSTGDRSSSTPTGSLGYCHPPGICVSCGANGEPILGSQRDALHIYLDIGSSLFFLYPGWGRWDYASLCGVGAASGEGAVMIEAVYSHGPGSAETYTRYYKTFVRRHGWAGHRSIFCTRHTGSALTEFTLYDWNDISDDEVRTRLIQRGIPEDVVEITFSLHLMHAREGCPECDEYLHTMLD